MNETKWTPGPWENQGEDAFADMPFIRVGVGDRTICEALPPVDAEEIDEETRANANLSAAAPDMYAALKIVSALQAAHPEVLAVVDAAMRKARGE